MDEWVGEWVGGWVVGYVSEQVSEQMRGSASKQADWLGSECKSPQTPGCPWCALQLQ